MLSFYPLCSELQQGRSLVALLCVLESLKIPFRGNFYYRASPTVENWKVQNNFSIYFLAKSSFADNINPKVFEHSWFWHILKPHPEQMSAVLNDKKEDTFTLYTYSQKLWILSVVRFGDGLKILILTSGGAILNYKGALYQYKSWRKTSPAKASTNSLRIGLINKTIPSKNRPPVLIIKKVRSGLSVMQTRRCCNSKDTAFSANK